MGENMKRKYKLVVLFLLVLATLLATNTVNAVNSTEQTEAKDLLDKYAPKDMPLMDELKQGEILSLKDSSYKNKPHKVVKIKISYAYTSGGDIVKKNGKYQQKVPVLNKVQIFDVY